MSVQGAFCCVVRIFSLQLVVLHCVLDGAQAKAEDSRPNILFILTDDQGWPTLGCYGGSHVPTPNLDRLASQGVRLTDAYVMPQCTPTRAALLTGQHTSRNGMWHVIGWYGTPWAPVSEPMFREHMEPSQCRLPHILRGAGYRTGMAGKWHLTNNEHGFYTYLRQKSAEVFGFDYVAPPGEGSQNEGDKWVDHLTDCACKFIEEDAEQPWFFYLSHHTLHNKVVAPTALTRKHQLMGAPEFGHFNATYLAAIEHLDDSVGRLLGRLDSLGQSRNTIVVFLADNGGIDSSYNLPEWDAAPLNGSRPLSIKEQHYDNAPLREGKGSVYEGGIRVPCIVRWPERINAGIESDLPVHIVDWLPTLCSAAGIEAEQFSSGRSGAVDGVDIFPALTGDDAKRAVAISNLDQRSLFWYMPLYDLRWKSTPSAVIRKGDWKLIHYFGDWYDEAHEYHRGEHTELYNLRSDISEQNDLSLQKPAVARRMKAELLVWITSTGARVPDANPHHDPQRSLKETKEKQPWMSAYTSQHRDD